MYNRRIIVNGSAHWADLSRIGDFVFVSIDPKKNPTVNVGDVVHEGSDKAFKIVRLSDDPNEIGGYAEREMK